MIIGRNIFGRTRAGLEETVVDMGEKAFHGRQLYKWMYKHRVFDFTEMTDIRLDLRAGLKQDFTVDLPSITDRQKSSDGTEKFLFRLADGKMIEAVLIEDDTSGRMTLCVSSQVGCALGCRFCATGYLGFDRNLTVGEILAQPLLIRNLYGEEAFDNLVFMGMGEPLLNYDPVMAAIDIMTDSLGMMIGAKRITLSTSGIVPGIRRLTQSRSKVNLALSLNAADENLRRRLMPVAKSYPLPEIMAAVREWTTVRKRRVTFEYILFKDINDGDDDALALAELIRGIPCKINLLAYNRVDGLKYKRPDDADIDRFARLLYPRTPAVTVRKSRGQDIAAACGQLAGRKKQT